MNRTKPQLEKSATVKELPAACADEAAAVDFMERKRWGDCPACPHCGSVAVYKMMDRKTGERNKRFLWRCREKECARQFTVRIGTVFEESRLPLRHWCYAFWRVSTSKKGCSALEIKRHCQINYQSALFLLHRVRWALAPANEAQPKLTGIIEADETYVGGKPRPMNCLKKRKWHTTKVPVFAAVQRGGNVRTRIMPVVNGANVRKTLREFVEFDGRLMTDEHRVYREIGRKFKGGHQRVTHANFEYARGDVTTNTIEGFFSILKRGLNGIYHSVSKEHLHRYLAEYEWRSTTTAS
jgi:hypothetical protein